MATDEKNIYLGGVVADSVWSGKTVFPGAGQSLLLSCWQQNGKLDWINRIDFTGTALMDVLQIAPGGNILAGGMYDGVLTLDRNKIENHGGAKAFLLEVTPNGKIVNTWFSSGTGNHRLASLDTDEQGNRYLLFHSTGLFSFSGIGLPDGQKLEKGGIILIKTDKEGNSQWLTSAEGSGYSEAVKVVAGQKDEVFVCANFNERFETGDTVLTTYARLATAIICYNGNRELNWAATSESNEMCRAMDALCTLNGNLLVTGQYQGRFTLGGSEFYRNVPGGSVFLVQLNMGGNIVWYDEPVAEGANFSKSITIDKSGNILLTGAFRGKAKLDDNLYTSAGEDDVLIAKYFNCGQIDIRIEQAAPLCSGSTCVLKASDGFETYLWNNSMAPGRSLTVKTPGIYTVAAFNRQGCAARDTIAVLKMEVPELELGNDTLLGPGEELELYADAGFQSYAWNDGVTGAYRTIAYKPTSEQERLILTAGTKEGCTAIDSLKVSFKPSSGNENPLAREWLSVYPNPVGDILWWSAKLSGKQDIIIRLIDSKSTTIIEREVKNYMPGSRESINMQSLAKGNYLLTLRSANITLNEKIIKTE